MLFALRDELDVISNMQVIDRELFYYLAGRTNLANGVIGKVCRVSYGGIASGLSESMESGRRKNLFTVTATEIRNSLARLVKKGLFGRLSKAGIGHDLILVRTFFVEYLNAQRSVKNELSKSLVDRLAQDVYDYGNNNNELGKEETRAYQANNSELSINIKQQQQQQPNFEKFSLSLNWQYDIASLKMILFRAFGSKHKISDIDPVWIAEFVSYWASQPGRQHTQAEWTARLGTRLIDYLRRPGHFDALRGIKAQEQKTYVEKNSKALPAWAKPPKDDAALVNWMLKHGYGNAPAGYGYAETRGWLRRKIDMRIQENNLPKVAH